MSKGLGFPQAVRLVDSCLVTVFPLALGTVHKREVSHMVSGSGFLVFTQAARVRLPVWESALANRPDGVLLKTPVNNRVAK